MNQAAFGINATYLSALMPSYLELSGQHASEASSYDYFAEAQQGIMKNELFTNMHVRDLPETEDATIIRETEEDNTCIKSAEL